MFTCYKVCFLFVITNLIEPSKESTASELIVQAEGRAHCATAVHAAGRCMQADSALLRRT